MLPLHDPTGQEKALPGRRRRKDVRCQEKGPLQCLGFISHLTHSEMCFSLEQSKPLKPLKPKHLSQHASVGSRFAVKANRPISTIPAPEPQGLRGSWNLSDSARSRACKLQSKARAHSRGSRRLCWRSARGGRGGAGTGVWSAAPQSWLSKLPSQRSYLSVNLAHSSSTSELSHSEAGATVEIGKARDEKFASSSGVVSDRRTARRWGTVPPLATAHELVHTGRAAKVKEFIVGAQLYATFEASAEGTKKASPSGERKGKERAREREK